MQYEKEQRDKKDEQKNKAAEMIKQNKPLEEIAEATGLSVAAIKQILMAQIKAATNLVELVKEYSELRYDDLFTFLRGKCPHPDYNASTSIFLVNEITEEWACIGCNHDIKDGGDCFAFIQWIEKLTLDGAIIRLAKRANIEIPEQ
jgi:DNA primase